MTVLPETVLVLRGEFSRVYGLFFFDLFDYDLHFDTILT